MTSFLDSRGSRAAISVSSQRHNEQLIRRACIGVYRPIATASCCRSWFMPHCLLAHGSGSQDRSNLSIAYISLLFPRCTISRHLLPPPPPPPLWGRYHKAREKSSNSREFIPPCVTGRFFFFSLLRSTIVTERCDRRSCSLISRLMSLLITQLLPAFICWRRLHLRSFSFLFIIIIVCGRKKIIYVEKVRFWKVSWTKNFCDDSTSSYVGEGPGTTGAM